MLKKYLECGKIVTTHGVLGEVKVEPWCDGPEYLRHFKTLYLDNEGARPLKVLGVRAVKNMALLRFEGYSSIDEAVTLRGKILYIDRADAPDDGSFFIQDLIGLNVRDADTGTEYGKVTNVFSTGANDVYEVTGADKKERLIPAIPDVIVETNPVGGFILIRPLKGLFDDAD